MLRYEAEHSACRGPTATRHWHRVSPLSGRVQLVTEVVPTPEDIYLTCVVERCLVDDPARSGAAGLHPVMLDVMLDP